MRIDQLVRDHIYLMSGGERRHIIQIKQHSVTYVPEAGRALVTVDDAEFAEDVLSEITEPDRQPAAQAASRPLRS